MSAATLACRVDARRSRLRRENSVDVTWNGIDFVEPSGDRDELFVHFLCPADVAAPPFRWQLCCERPAASVQVQEVCHAAGTSLAVLHLDRPLAFGTYTLHVDDRGFDPRHASAQFTVAADTTDVDPKPSHVCPPPARSEPEINYLAKDYASFRQLLFDRLAQTAPEWKDRHVPDLGVTLVELLAYVGDYLSYHQDAVATEAYLGTARQRISVRRHARLVDYDLDEGCNARAFVHIEVSRDGVPLDRGNVQFITRPPEPRLQDEPVLAAFELGDDLPRPFTVFELMDLPRPCRVDDGRDELVRNVPGFCGWLLDAGEWLLGLFPSGCAAAVRDCRGAESADDLAELWSPLQRALRLVVEQDCLLTALDRAGKPLADTVRYVLNTIQCRTVRNRCLLQETVPHLVLDPRASSEVRLFTSLNRMSFYTWSQQECCLPPGTTRATLRDAAVDAKPYFRQPSGCSEYLQRMSEPSQLGRLQPGDILIFEEQFGPKTHRAVDAEPTHRQAVRLARVAYDEDPVTGERIAEIEWHAEDALRFPLCISSAHAATGAVRADVSVALGNIVLVDHGARIEREELEFAPTPPEAPAERSLTAAPRPFRPTLKEPAITFSEPIAGCPSATRLLSQKPHEARPQIWLNSSPPGPGRESGMGTAVGPFAALALFEPGDLDNASAFESLLARLDGRGIRRLQRLAGGETSELNDWLDAKAAGTVRRRRPGPLENVRASLKQAMQWTVVPNLLDSGADERHAVLEVDNDRRGHLRFGDGQFGRRPQAGEAFWVQYRVGSGPSGNVGPDKIAHLVYHDQPVTGITSVRNPLAAQGGRPHESLRHAKLMAPSQFRELRRAVIAEDYVTLVRSEFPDRVQAAAATLDWIGASFEIAVAVDAFEGVNLERLLQDVERRLQQYRRMGHRLRVQRPIDVPLDIALTVCVTDGYLRAHVQRELLLAFNNRKSPNGGRGFFHHDNFTFGQPLYLSRMIRVARDVEGVENVAVTRFQRLGQGDNGELANGLMTFGAFEIPRLDNDGLAPHRGRLCLNMRGDR